MSFSSRILTWLGCSIGLILQPILSFAQPTENMWAVIATNFKLNHDANNPEVLKQIRWFEAHPAYFQKIASQGQPYIAYIYQQVKAHGLPGELVLLPMIESAYDPFAYSWVGAAGLWQMMPATGSNFGLKQDWWYDGRKDIISSTKAALDYLTYLNTFFNGNWPLAIAAYNSGEGTVQHAIDRNAHRDRNTDFFSLNLPAETESYVPRLLALAAIIQNPSAYNVNLPNLKTGSYFTVLSLDKQIDLAQAAKMAGISLTLLYELNPGYNRWATDPKGPYRLLLPTASLPTFQKNYGLPQTKVNSNQAPAPKLSTEKPLLPKLPTHELENVLGETSSASAPSVSKANPDAPSSTPTNPSSSIHPITSKVSAKPTPLPIQYTVKKGDTLWAIANKYKVTVGEIRTWNKLSLNQKVKEGQILIIRPSIKS